MRSAAPLALVVALAGCGGDDGGKRLTAAEYRSQADAICAKANEDLRELEPPDSLGAMRSFVDEARPIAEGAVDDLDDLEPPQQLEPAHERWIQQNRHMVELLDDLKNQGLPGVASKAREFDRAAKTANDTARDDLGLDDCGREN